MGVSTSPEGNGDRFGEEGLSSGNLRVVNTRLVLGKVSCLLPTLQINTAQMLL